MKPILVVQGAEKMDDVPGLDKLADEAEIRFADSADELGTALAGAEVLLGWNFRADSLRDAWGAAADLRWIHWGGAGVDAAMFPELRNSGIELTNSRGVFDRAMAEWVLGMIICFAKKIPQTFECQLRREWNYRLSETIVGKRALVVGAGSIGRAIGRLLRAAGMQVEGVGRSARAGGPDFERVHAIADLHACLASSDYVILVTPLTEDTRNLFGAAEFAAMPSHARFVNVGRGALVDEPALLVALQQGSIAGAALDVFVDEPLPPESPFWKAPNCLVSPHMSGDFAGYNEVIARQFLDNWARYRAGEALENRIDKRLGFAAAGA